MSRRLTFPLFWRIFLTIWLAMAVAVVASNMVTRYLMDRERETIERQVGLQDLAREAVDIRERLGRVETWRFLRREGERRDLHLLLIERDLDLGRLPKSVRERMDSFWHPQKPAAGTPGLTAWWPGRACTARVGWIPASFRPSNPAWRSC